MKQKLLLLVFTVTATLSLFAQPKISSFSPIAGPVGTSVTIIGTDFSSVATNNIVYFGAARAVVTFASATSLIVTVPFGTTSAPISVTKDGLTTYSQLPFNATFTAINNDFSNGSFGRSDVIQGTDNATATVTGDFDGDGKIDLASVIGSILLIRRNISVGDSIKFATSISYTLYDDYSHSSTSIVTGDFDGDGLLDIATASYFASGTNPGTILVFRNQGSPGNISFGYKMDFAVGNYPNNLVVGDLNNDGKPDIAVANSNSNTISILKNTSSGSNINFASKIDFATGTNPYGISISDFDGDSNVDIAVSNKSNNSVSILRNITTSGSISFASKIDYNTPSTDPCELSTGDIDGDGKTDIVTVNRGSKKLSIFKNNSNLGVISFATMADMVTTYSPLGLKLADMNGDGKIDIVTTTDLNYKLAVFKNTSTTNSISFSSIRNLNDIRNGPPPSISCGDFNNDGRPDILVTYWSGNALSIFRNRFDEPFIFSFTPTTAGSGQTVTITGENFNGATQVRFAGKDAASFSVVNPNTINALISPGTGINGYVSVKTAIGKDSLWGFTFSGPIISSFNPTSTGAGATVTIYGTNFTGASSVSFGTVAATSFSVVNSSTISAVVAAASQSGNVSVTTPFGTASKSGFIFIPPPTISSFNPISAGAGSTVTITGTNLSSITSVLFGGTAASYFYISSPTTIIAQVGNAGSSGNISISGPQGTASLAGFNFLPSATISSFAPTNGGLGTAVVIKGTNLSTTLQVMFGNVNASSFTVVSDTVINAIVSSGASGNVTVITNTSSYAIATGFVYTGPSIISFSPTSGTTGTVVTLTGTNFVGTTTVSFGGVFANFNIVSQNQITAVVPSGTVSGDIVVSTPNGTATITGFNYPYIKSFTPSSGTNGTAVLIKGINFNGCSAVTFGDSLVSSFTVLSDTAISAILDNGASGVIKVSSTLGIATSTSVFFYYKPLPQLTFMSPTFGGQGTLVTIKGKNFGSVTSVKFGGIAAGSFSIISDTVLTAVVGGGATGVVTLISPNGNYTGTLFTYVTSPQIYSFAPETANVGSQVTISGANFNALPANNKVFFGGIPANVISSNNNSVTVIVPAGACTDFITLTTNNLSGISKKMFVTTFPNTLTTFSSNSFIQDYTSARGLIRLAADFDGDGKPDLITSDSAYSGLGPNDSFYVSRNVSVNDSVILGEKRFIARGGNNYAAADLNNDGKLDLLIAYRNGFRYYINSSIPGSISFQSPINIVSSLGMNNFLGTSITPADFDNDGRTDLLFAASDAGFQVYRNTVVDGNLVFTPTSSSSLYPIAVKVVDIDGDGRMDIVATSSSSGSATNIIIDGLYVFINTTTAQSITFSNSMINTGFTNLGSWDIKDFDGDGKADLAIVQNVSPYKISFFKNTSSIGNASFSVRTDYGEGKRIGNMAFGDYDGDGKLDMAYCINDTLRIYRNTLTTPGIISFTKNCSYIFPIWNIAAMDLNLDGKVDIVGSGYASAPNLNTFLLKNMSDKAKIVASGVLPIIGSIYSTVIVDPSVQTYNGNPYVQRHFSIEPSINPASSTGTVTLYFTQAEFDNFNSHPLHGTNLPTGATDIISKSNLRVLQYHGTSTSNIPGTYSGSSVVIDPEDINIVWNPASMLWEVKFDVVGFSGFFVSSVGNSVVPLQLLSFEGKLIGKNAVLSWTSINEVNTSHFDIEKSIIGSNFTTLKTIQAAGNSNALANYQYEDLLTIPGLYYYRLKMTDKNGSSTYSQVVKIKLDNNSQFLMYPNPAKDNITIEHPFGKIAQLKIIDAVGRVVKSLPILGTASQTNISIVNLPAGIYKIIWSDGANTENQTLIKQ